MRAGQEADLWFLFLFLHEFLDDTLYFALLVPLDLVHGSLVLEQIGVVGLLALSLDWLGDLLFHCCKIMLLQLA